MRLTLRRTDPGHTAGLHFVLTTLLVACATVSGFVARPASAQQALTHLAEVQGQVFVSRIVGQTLYLGGSISAAGRRVSFAAPLAIADGQPASHSPRFAGASSPQVTSIISDGNGGWFVGGTFETIDGQPHVNLAHLDATLQVTSWSPPAPDGIVNAMATDGTTLWLGGAFTHMGAAARGLGAAVSVASAQLLTWDAQADNEILALALSGTNVYVGGRFAGIAGGSHPQLALLNATTGVAQSFTAQATTPGGAVHALALDGGVLYAGGAFANMGGAARANVAAFNTTTGALVGSWRPNPNGPVFGLQATTAGVFIGGAFGTIGGGTRAGIAQSNKTNGNLTAWNANADAGITAMTLANGVLYLAGQFQNIGGQSRSTLGAVDALTGLATAWHPAASPLVVTLAAGNGHVFAGGQFTDLGGLKPRTNLAAIDLVSGDLLPWSPTANAPVRTMQRVGGTLHLGGDFTQLNGTARVGLAAVDAVTGALSSWNPTADGAVRSMVPMGSLMYVGGFFNTVGGTARAHLAAVDLVTGALAGWDPGANSPVWALATDGVHIFAGGNFASVGGIARPCVASLDPVTAAVLPWTVGLQGTFKFGGQFVAPVVYTLAVQGSELYIGGSFGAPNGWWCGVGADVSTAAITSWRPFVPFSAGVTEVHAVQPQGTLVITGGKSIPLSAFDQQTQALSPWAPPPGDVVSLSSSGPLFVVGWGAGDITVYADPASLDTPLPRAAQRLLLSPSVPNPIRTSGRIGFTLASASAVDLALFDVSGRHVRTLIGGEVMAAGPHQVQVTSVALPPGVYLARLQAAGETRLSRIVVLP